MFSRIDGIQGVSSSDHCGCVGLVISRFLEMTASVPASDWMTVDRDKMSGTVNRVPVREEINPIANEQLVVELYSR